MKQMRPKTSTTASFLRKEIEIKRKPTISTKPDMCQAVQFINVLYMVNKDADTISFCF